MLAAESVGKFFLFQIKGKYEDVTKLEGDALARALDELGTLLAEHP
jgi:hypothetical protein